MLKPLHDYVILKKEQAEKQTASGIILTNPKEQASNQATVVAVGPKCDDHLKEETEYMILEEEDILAIVE